MKLTNFLWLIAVPGSLYAQNFYDDFSDSDFNNPFWLGDTAHFEIVDEQLMLNQNQSGTSFLATHFDQSNVKEWRFEFDLDFAPSNNNYLEIYWKADTAILDVSSNAYFFRIGENGSDDGLVFYKKELGTTSEIARLGDGLFAQGGLYHLRIRNNQNDWSVYWDANGGTEFDSLGSFVDSTSLSGAFFGLQCTYTSSNADGFSFDDIYMGSIQVDTIGPKLTELEVISSNELFLQFDEAILPFSNSQIAINHSVSIDSILQQNSSITLFLTDVLENKTNYQIAISNLEDLKGNQSQVDTNLFFSYADYFEVRINEIMLDPEPAVQLQNQEYIELYNASSSTFNLKDWTIEVNGNVMDFPDMEFSANSYLLLCAEDYGLSNSIVLALPSLTNSSGEIAIKNRFGMLVHRVFYSDDWYNGPWKEEGGWSLEMAVNANECNGDEAWQASINTNGGTPGFANSWEIQEVLKDPELIEMVLISDSVLELRWNQNFSNSAIKSLQFIGIHNLKRWDWKEGNRNSIALISESSIREEGLSFYWYGADFCSGLLHSDTVLIPPIKYPNQGDVLINELMLEPSSDQTEYIEWYNNSDSSLLLSDLRLAKESDGVLSQLELCSEEQKLFLPGDYLAITEDAILMKSAFSEIKHRNLVEVKQLPSLDNDEGEVAVYSSKLERIEWCSYSKSWHFTEDHEFGNALERISLSGGNTSNNWTTSANIGTPGYKNSVMINGHALNSAISVGEFFSPNQDGHQDLLEVHYDLEKPSEVSILVFNEIGVQQYTLVERALLQGQGALFWDGRTDAGSVAEKGIYIVFFDAVDENGNHLIHKSIAVLGGD